MKFWPLQPRQPCTGLAIAAIAGIVAAEFWPLPPLPVLAVIGLAAPVVMWSRRTLACCAFTAAVFFALHVLRHHGSEARGLAREFAGGSKVVRATGIVWSEPTAPKVWSRTVTARFRMKLEAIEIDGVKRASDALMNVSWAGEMPAYGDRIELIGAAQNLAPVRNPGQFDLPDYLRRCGIYSEIWSRFASDCRILEHGRGSAAQALALRARGWMKGQLERDLDDSPEIAALIESMVLGLRGETPDDVKELFQRTGTLHLFAVSGLNVAMLAAITWFLLKPLGVRRSFAVLVTIPVLIAYAFVTGLSASCVRATIMGAFVLVAFLFDRPPVLYNSLSAAAFAILAWDTNQLFSPGFQFSFVLVFVIVLLAARIQRRAEPLGLPDAFLPRPLWSWRQKLGAHGWKLFAATLGVTLAAWIGSLAFTAGYFHLFSLSAIFANLLAVPIAFGVLGLGLLSILVCGASPFAAVLFNNANWLCAKFLLFVVSAFAALPGGHLYVETPRWAASPDCEVMVFDFGEGGASHVRVGSRDWLVDCGDSFRYAHATLPYLRSRGVNRLDGFILTHGDAKHIGAAVEVLDDFLPRRVIDSPLLDRSSARRNLHAQLAARERGKSLCHRGDVLRVSPFAQWRVLFPPADLARSVADDKALVLVLEVRGGRILFMSDGGFATEQWLLENEPDLRADVLVKGQHSQDISGTLDFVGRVQPRAVICAAPEFGQSSAMLDDWVTTVSARGIAVFRQDQTGAVSIAIRAGTLEMRALMNGQRFPVQKR